MTTQYDTIWKEDDLTSVTSPTLRLQSTWSSASFYDSSLVNHNITLESLNLDNIRVVFSKHRSVINIWENVCKLRNVVGKHTVARISGKLYRAKWYLNNIWISDGVSSKKNKATIAASTNALIFLTRNKGLNIIPVERILNENILRIGSKTLTVGTSNDFQVISDKVGDILNNFLDNSKIAKLEFSLDTISDEVKDEIHKLARQFKLGHRNEGTLPNKKACIWKTSDTLHNLKDVYLNFNDLASIKRDRKRLDSRIDTTSNVGHFIPSTWSCSGTSSQPLDISNQGENNVTKHVIMYENSIQSSFCFGCGVKNTHDSHLYSLKLYVEDALEDSAHIL